MYYRIRYKNELSHYGIKGQHWGERRYQNEDGSYTPEGRIHYGIGSENERRPRTILGQIIRTTRHIENRRKEIHDQVEENKRVHEYMLKNGKGRVIDTKYSDIRKAKEYAENTKGLSELQRKNGFIRDEYGSISKKVNGIHCSINDDSDIKSINLIAKDKNYFKNSPIEKAMKKEVNDVMKMQGTTTKTYPKLQSIYAAGGTAEASYWYDDQDPLGGHEISVEFDPKTKKVYSTSMNG